MYYELPLKLGYLEKESLKKIYQRLLIQPIISDFKKVYIKTKGIQIKGNINIEIEIR